MPIVGRNRRAKPRDVWEVFRDEWARSFIDVFPVPKPSESFNSYLKRLDWKEEVIFFAMIAAGCTKDDSPVTQREFLSFLDDMSEALNKVRFGLHARWPGR
jgi:hypothetical protein